MAVASKQIEEIYSILEKYIDVDRGWTIEGLLEDLSLTQAYTWNKSFRETINRLREFTKKEKDNAG